MDWANVIIYGALGVLILIYFALYAARRWWVWRQGYVGLWKWLTENADDATLAKLADFLEQSHMAELMSAIAQHREPRF